MITKDSPFNTEYHTTVYKMERDGKGDVRYLWILDCLTDEMKDSTKDFTSWERKFINDMIPIAIANKLTLLQKVKLEEIYKERQ